MKLLKPTVALLIISLGLNCYAADTIDINKKVSIIDDEVSKGVYHYAVIKSESVTEGVLPEYHFYHDNGTLRLVKVVVGHETWFVTHSYYLWPDGSMMKYLKVIKERPDNPAREAIIYDESGKVIWKNTDKLPAPAQKVIQLFESYYTISKDFAHY